MTQRTTSPHRRGFRARLAAALGWPFVALSAGLEILIGGRGLRLLFLIGAAVLAVSGWVRPPLSPDIRGVYLPLGVLGDNISSAEAFLRSSRSFVPLSVGSVALVVILLGTLVVAWRPRYFRPVAGLVLCTGLIGNAAAALNHPALIEAMDVEYEQRRQATHLLIASLGDDNVLIRPGNARLGANSHVMHLNGRVSTAATRNQEWGEWLRGWNYLLYGPWLIVWSAAGFLLAGEGPWWRRTVALTPWAALGAGLAVAVTSPRLMAEHHWRQAKQAEAHGDFEGARELLETAVNEFPEFARMQRTRLLAGALDYWEGRHTVREQYFRAFQYSLNKAWLPAVNLMADVRVRETEDPALVQTQTARIYAQMGLSFYPLTRYTAAKDAWANSARLDPGTADTALYLGHVTAKMDRHDPELVQTLLGYSMTPALGDRVFRADVFNILGNTNFEAASLMDARRSYARSSDAFNLPKIMNYRALDGLGGK